MTDSVPGYIYCIYIIGYFITFYAWWVVDTHPDYWTEDGFLNTILSPIFWPITLPVALYRCYKITHTPLGQRVAQRQRVDVEYEEAMREVESSSTKESK